MKKVLFYILIIFLLNSCSDKDAFDCVKKSGTVRDYEITLSGGFDSLNISSNIDVDLIQGAHHRVVLTTGENLFDDIRVEVADGLLIFENNNTCNWARDYGVTKLQITTPDLRQIVYEGGGVFLSKTKLVFDTLTIDTKFSSGDFHLDIEANELNITSTRISNYYMTGSVNSLNLYYRSGDGRFYGKDLIAQHVSFYHFGTNDIMVYPVVSLEGTIDRYGNVIYYNDPINTPQVEELSKGRLIRK
ncbi:MAG: DUF2807 domain-containing protein [Cyclobacteriaceae bacterium]